MVRFISLFLFTTGFLGAQSYAAVCELKCGLHLSKSTSETQKSEDTSMPCHPQSTSAKAKSQGERGACSNLCQTEDFPVVDIELLTYFNTDLDLVFNLFLGAFLEEESIAAKVIYSSGDISSGPPTFGFFEKASVIIQKSSYLI